MTSEQRIIALVMIYGLCLSTQCSASATKLENAAASLSKAQCDAIYSCNCGWTEQIYQDKEECEEIRRESYQGMIDFAIQADLKYDRDCMQLFLESYDLRNCDVERTEEELNQFIEKITKSQCSKIFYGTQSAGQKCNQMQTIGDDCKQHLICVDHVCEEHTIYGSINFTKLQVGEICGLDTTRVCDDGLSCVRGIKPYQRICAPIPERGEACLGEEEVCGEGLYCSNHVCIDGPEEGADCAMDGSSTTFYCGIDLICDESIYQCVKLPSIGEPCIHHKCAEEATCDWENNICTAIEPSACFL